MDAKILDTTLKLHLELIRERLEEAAGIVRAAEACASAGNIQKGVEVLLDVEQPIYEANTLLNATSLINRIGRT